jgi:hypothetical protein
MERVACLLAMSAGLIAFSACSHGKPDPNAAAFAAVSSGTGDDFRAAIHNNTKLFQSGPQQLSGADALLKKGTLVRMVRHQLGYSLVQTATTSQLGWVANDDLGPAAPSDLTEQTGTIDNALAPSEPVLAGPMSPAPVSKAKNGDSAIVEQYQLDDPDHPESVSRRQPPHSKASPQPTPQP